MSVLYCSEPGLKLHRVQDYLELRKEKKKVQTLPVAHLEKLIIGNMTSVSTGVLFRCLQQGIPVHFVTGNYWYAGSLISGKHAGHEVRDAQYRIAFDEVEQLRWCKKFLDAKLRDIRARVRRWKAADKSRVSALINRAAQAGNVGQLRGYEGAASRLYFQLMKQQVPSHWNFTRRSKNPPEDAVNSVISFCYALLYTAVSEAVQLAGFDPYRGWLHERQQGHPAFVSDCMELYRCVIAGPVILKILQNNSIHPNQFTGNSAGGGIEINPAAKREIIRMMEEKFHTRRTICQETKTHVEWIRHDLNMLKNALITGNRWKPVRLRQ